MDEVEHRPYVRARPARQVAPGVVVAGALRVECGCGWRGPLRRFADTEALAVEQTEAYVDHREHVVTGGTAWVSDAAIVALIERELRG